MNLDECAEILKIVQDRLEYSSKRNPKCLNLIDVPVQLELLSKDQLTSTDKLRLLVEFHRLPNRHVLASITKCSLLNFQVCNEKLEKQFFVPEIIKSVFADSSVWPFEILSYCRDWLELRIRSLRNKKPIPNYSMKKLKQASRSTMYKLLNGSKETSHMGLSNRTTNRDTDFDKQMSIIWFMNRDPIFLALYQTANEHGTRFIPSPSKLWKISQLENDQERMTLFFSKVEYRLDIAYWMRMKCDNPNSFATWLEVVINRCRVEDKKPPRQWSTQQIISSMLPCVRLLNLVKS